METGGVFLKKIGATQLVDSHLLVDRQLCTGGCEDRT
jgi:hypothetical protein